MKLTISQEGCNPITIRTVESKSPKDNDINDTIRKIEQLYKINIPSQFKQSLMKYNNDLGKLYGRQMNTIPLNGDPKKFTMIESMKWNDLLKKTAYKDFIPVESMGDGDYIVIYKTNELYYYSHDTKKPIAKLVGYKDYNDFFNKTIKSYFGKKDKAKINYSTEVDKVAKSYYV